MAHSTLLLAVVTLAINVFYSTKLCLSAECTPTNYVAFRDRIAEGVDGPAQVPHPGRFLANAYIFGCHGNISQWEAYTFDNGSHPIEFHVWRANKTITDVFHLVGINTFQDAQPDANHLISFSVPPEEQITVSPGDFAGIRTVMSEQAGSGEGFRIQFDDGGRYRQYFRGIPPDETIPTPATLELRPFISGAFLTFEAGSGRSPIMRATVIALCDPPCQNGGECVGPNECSCSPGYTGVSCEGDINECALGESNNCNIRAECINTIGSHSCICHAGFTGNGTHCEDLNECLTGTHNYIEGALCINTIGAFRCVCSSQNGLLDCTGFGITTAEASVTTTTMLMPSTQDTPPITTADSVTVTVLSQSIIIVVAVLGGVLVLTVFIVIVSIVICCILCNNRRKMSANQGPPSTSINRHLWNGQLVDNPSYNISDNDLQLVSNQSYLYSDNYINLRELSGNPGRPSASLNGHQLNDQLVNDPSYNVGDYGLELVRNQSYHCDNPMLVRNQAYNQAQNHLQLVNNPAYNSNDQEDPYYSVIN